MKSITIVAEDRVGLLADISYILGKAKINIESLTVDSVGGKAVIIVMVKDPEKAVKLLKNAGYKASSASMLNLKMDDKPAELSKITNMLAADKISITNVHILSRDGKHTVVGLVVDKEKKARQLLEQYLIDK